MSVQNPEPTPTPEPATISTDELRDTVGDEVDARMEARGLTASRLEKLDLLDSILPDIEGLFGKLKPNPDPVDKQSLLSEIGSLIDSKLAKLGGNSGGSPTPNNTGRRVGPLGRFLSADRS